MNYHLRKIDEATYIKLKNHAEENKISINELINIILDRAVATNEMESQNQKVLNAISKHTMTNNKLVEVFQDQTEAINKLISEINQLIR